MHLTLYILILIFIRFYNLESIKYEKQGVDCKTRKCIFWLTKYRKNVNRCLTSSWAMTLKLQQNNPATKIHTNNIKINWTEYE